MHDDSKLYEIIKKEGNTAFAEDSDLIDTDVDGKPDYLDLDSDDDGIFDVIESGKWFI